MVSKDFKEGFALKAKLTTMIQTKKRRIYQLKELLVALLAALLVALLKREMQLRLVQLR